MTEETYGLILKIALGFFSLMFLFALCLFVVTLVLFVQAVL